MTKPSRNAPCPCGSGKKYKQCCLFGQAAVPEKSRIDKPSSAPWGGWEVVEDELDTLSNRIVDLIEEGRLEEARAACEELRERYPKEYDWMERLGQVEEARGNYASAAQHYREAFNFLEGKSDYDPEIQEWLRQQAQAMEAKARQPRRRSSDS
jgi:tetratricopeptide (TPR) repeat protein